MFKKMVFLINEILFNVVVCMRAKVCELVQPLLILTGERLELTHER